jgi:cytochrome c oxidase subunit 2
VPQVWKPAIQQTWKSAALLGTAALLSGCKGKQDVLDVAGPQAERVAHLWNGFLIVEGVILLLVTLAVLRVAFRSTTQKLVEPPLPPNPKQNRFLTIVVSSLVGVTVIILSSFLFAEMFAGRAAFAMSQEPNALNIKVIGHQWWWEVQYMDAVASNIVITANEIHIPTDRAIQLQLDSVDVIHSFWAPNFDGKKDLVPGHPTVTWFKASRSGSFRGQCAEFCGAQHAHMRFVMIAEEPNKFQQWLETQRHSAPQPQTDEQKHGYQVFMGTTCVMCHSIQGTDANGLVGPNLTHIASRKMIAAGSRPNTVGHLAGWIMDPQKIKPGVLMPQHTLSPQDLRALLEYLETLK